MKKLQYFTTVAVLSTVGLSTQARAGSPNEAVTGGGKHVGLTEGISAHGIRDNTRGNVTITDEADGLFAHGEVTCLVVTGNRAVITWVVTSTNSTLPEGTLVATEVVDNGDPGQQTTPDFIRNSFEGFIIPDPDNPGCFLPVLPPVPVESGNYVVQDA
jgi:hypothetical protein